MSYLQALRLLLPYAACMLRAASSFTIRPGLVIQLYCSKRRSTVTTLLFAAGSEGDTNIDSGDDFDDDFGEEDDAIQPYGNRSLAWTKRYRKLNPYEKCRQRVLSFGHRSKEDWDEAVESGQLGSYVPSYPNKMYAPEWVSWEEWLGLMRPYEETRNLAANVLSLRSFDEYILFVRSNPKRSEGLRIPVRPDIFYKDEWTSEEDFFRQEK